MILHNYHRYIQPDWLYNLENKTEILPAVPPLMSLVSVLLLLAQTGLSSSRSGLQCYVGNCSSWEDCRRPGLITDCPPDHHYTACLTFIDQKCKLLLRVSSLSSIFAVCRNFKITIEQLMYRHQHKIPGLWSRNFKSQCFKIVKVFKAIRLKCSQFETSPGDISSLRSQDEKDSKLSWGVAGPAPVLCRGSHCFSISSLRCAERGEEVRLRVGVFSWPRLLVVWRVRQEVWRGQLHLHLLLSHQQL